MGKETVDIGVKIIKLTELAVFIDDGYTRTWLPLSQIEQDITEDDVDSHMDLTIHEWLAIEKELV